MSLRHLFNVAHASIRAAVKRVRSPKWRALEKSYLALHDTCAACGGRERLQVHHVEAFREHPELELDPGNLLSLCMSIHEDHLRLGHGGNFRAYNPFARQDAGLVRRMPQAREAVEQRARKQRRFD